MESGGKEYSVSASVAPRKLGDRICGVLGATCEPKLAGGHWGSFGESGFEGRFWKSGRRTRWDFGKRELAGACRSRSMMSREVSRMPRDPTTGVPTVKPVASDRETDTPRPPTHIANIRITTCDFTQTGP